MVRNDENRTLSPDEARRIYDRIGRLQDWQSFYELAAIDDLIAHADFELASSVYELGCGTGNLGRRLLTDHLPPSASYHGIDISETMVRLASDRLAPWKGRADATLVTGRLPLPGDDHGFDRFIAVYVLDLLSDAYLRAVLDEARRLLTSDGKLCLVSLTRGPTRVSRAISDGWRWIARHVPQIVGGCRPIDLEQQLSDRWVISHRRVVTSWGVSSEVVIARPADLGV